ncbi:MazG family protein [Kribbella flavida DSM 17836]|uniref:MazG family protein n=1 Tax=Kribbella flavida (strain DSM 17836 / JCM 10339 / NBRC 14399) TaxID=479435 RepID=D2PPA8_KRIFD|nr:MazG family protein [Kribbella flavida]ADB34704.1 MazG family protein [Kribbella flavida DSM 17836]
MIKVVLTSPRVAPGLMTRAAWQALEQAEVIGAAAGVESPTVQAVVGSGLVVTSVEGGPDAQWGWLTTAAESDRRVAWLVGEDGEPALLRLVADHLGREPRPAYEVEILHGSYDVPGARLLDLVQVMDRLRRNCPWDQEQTHASLAKYLLEETYETLEAIDSGDREHLREELGDLLLQVVFHARIAEEAPAEDEDDESDGPWSIDDVAAGIVEKLIRRHPHVFGTVDAADAAAVEANWETIKAAEKQRSSVLEGVPQALPALALADKVLSRAAKVLAAASAPTSGMSATAAASGELAADELGASDEQRIGAALLDLVRQARVVGVDPESALRQAVRRLADEVRAAEA